MFIINLNYRKAIEEVEKHLNDHVAFLNEQYEKEIFIFSGRKKPRTGGIILANVSNKEEVESIIKKDPFYKYDIAEYEIIEFEISKYDDRFGAFIK